MFKTYNKNKWVSYFGDQFLDYYFIWTYSNKNNVLDIIIQFIKMVKI